MGQPATPVGLSDAIDQLTSDVTAGPGPGSVPATIAAGVVSNSKLANMTQATIKGRASGAGTGAPQDLTAAQVNAILGSGEMPAVSNQPDANQTIQSGTKCTCMVIGDLTVSGVDVTLPSGTDLILVPPQFLARPADQTTFTYRLTTVSGDPCPASDQTSVSTLYLTPINNDGSTVTNASGVMWLRDSGNTRWNPFVWPEISKSLGTLVAFQQYDVFVYDNAGTPTMEFLEWGNATVTMTIATPGVVTWTGHGLSTGNSISFTTSGSLPTGVSANTQYWVTVIDANTFKLSTSVTNLAAGTFVATSGSQSGTHTGHAPRNRQTALADLDGVLVKSGDPTRRWVGCFMTTSTTTTEDSGAPADTASLIARRFVWNYQNRRLRKQVRYDNTPSWTNNGNGTWSPLDAGAACWRHEFICGLSGDPVEALVACYCNSVTSSATGSWACAIDGATYDSTKTSISDFTFANGGEFLSMFSQHIGHVGYHYLQGIQTTTNTNTVTFFGTQAGVGGPGGGNIGINSGMISEVWA